MGILVFSLRLISLAVLFLIAFDEIHIHFFHIETEFAGEVAHGLFDGLRMAEVEGIAVVAREQGPGVVAGEVGGAGHG